MFKIYCNNDQFICKYESEKIFDVVDCENGAIMIVCIPQINKVFVNCYFDKVIISDLNDLFNKYIDKEIYFILGAVGNIGEIFTSKTQEYIKNKLKSEFISLLNNNQYCWILVGKFNDYLIENLSELMDESQLNYTLPIEFNPIIQPIEKITDIQFVNSVKEGTNTAAFILPKTYNSDLYNFHNMFDNRERIITIGNPPSWLNLENYKSINEINLDGIMAIIMFDSDDKLEEGVLNCTMMGVPVLSNRSKQCTVHFKSNNELKELLKFVTDSDNCFQLAYNIAKEWWWFTDKWKIELKNRIRAGATIERVTPDLLYVSIINRIEDINSILNTVWKQKINGNWKLLLIVNEFMYKELIQHLNYQQIKIILKGKVDLSSFSEEYLIVFNGQCTYSEDYTDNVLYNLQTSGYNVIGKGCYHYNDVLINNDLEYKKNVKIHPGSLACFGSEQIKLFEQLFKGSIYRVKEVIPTIYSTDRFEFSVKKSMNII